MSTFREFVDKKTREAKKQLFTLDKVLKKEGVNTANHLEDDDPYLFVRSPGKLSFDGIRIYKIGDNIAYRVQKEEETHPYGKAYSLDVEGMYEDYISDDDYDESKAGKEVMKSIVSEIRNFFNKSAEAENELRDGEFDKAGDPLGRVMMKSTGTDYSSKVTNSNPSRNY